MVKYIYHYEHNDDIYQNYANDTLIRITKEWSPVGFSLYLKKGKDLEYYGRFKSIDEISEFLIKALGFNINERMVDGSTEWNENHKDDLGIEGRSDYVGQPRIPYLQKEEKMNIFKRFGMYCVKVLIEHEEAKKYKPPIVQEAELSKDEKIAELEEMVTLLSAQAKKNAELYQRCVDDLSKEISRHT